MTILGFMRIKLLNKNEYRQALERSQIKSDFSVMIGN